MAWRRATQLAQFVRPASLTEFSVSPRSWAARDRLRYPISNPLSNPDGFGGYARWYRFDARGVPCTPGSSGALYDPLVVARFGIRMSALAVEQGDAVAAGRADAVLEPLLESLAATGAWGRSDRASGMSSGLPSAIVQGVGISAVLRITRGRPDERVRAAIESAFRRLAAPIRDGGTSSQLDGGTFLEEYPAEPPTHVLNGAVYALIGLYDLEDTLQHGAASALAREVEATLERSIERFAAPFGWSRYALDIEGRPMLASAHYQSLHVAGMRLLHARTGRAVFARWADRWERSLHAWWCRLPVAACKVGETLAARRRHPIETLQEAGRPSTGAD